MPDFDPRANGHRLRSGDKPAAPRGSGVLLVMMVSALTGLNLLIGAGLGVIVGSAVRGEDPAPPALVVIGAGMGGAMGVWLGVRVALHYGGAGGFASTRWLTAWGLAGLVGSIALAGLVASPFTPIVAVTLPGLAALAGDRFITRRRVPPEPRRTLRETEGSE